MNVRESYKYQPTIFHLNHLCETDAKPFLILTCLPAHFPRSSCSPLMSSMLLCEDKPSRSVSLFLGCLTTEMMLSPLPLILAGRTTRSSIGGSGGMGTWRRCKMEEAVVRWICHVSGCFLQAFHLSFLSSLIPLSFSVPALFLLLRAVGKGLSLVSLSPPSSSNLSVYSA